MVYFIVQYLVIFVFVFALMATGVLIGEIIKKLSGYGRGRKGGSAYSWQPKQEPPKYSAFMNYKAPDAPDSAYGPQQDVGFREPDIYPYCKQHLLTRTEYKFYNILKCKCDPYKMVICPKVRLEDFIGVTTSQNKLKYRGYIRSRHVDFVLCDKNLNIVAAIELDDSSHNTEKAKKIDEFKDKLFKVIHVPLYRVPVGKVEFEVAIDVMLHSLYMSQKAPSSAEAY